VEHDRPGRRRPGRGGSGRTGVGRDATGAAPPRLGGAVRGEAGATVRGALGGGARGSGARERCWRKKGRGRVLYSLMFVGPTHQLTNISRLAYMTVVAPYVRRLLDEYMLHTSI
jgi:hypothetical protein